MPYIPEEHKQYPVLPYCREHGGEVFQYHNLPEKELESLVGEHLIPYGYDSYEAYFEKIEGLIKEHRNEPETVALLQKVKSDMAEWNRKEEWSICRFIGERIGHIFGLHSGGYYYWPTCASDPKYGGVIDDEEFTAYLFPTDPELWEIVVDPTGMAQRTIFENDNALSRKKYNYIIRQLETMQPDAFEDVKTLGPVDRLNACPVIKVRVISEDVPDRLLPGKIYDATVLESGGLLIKDESGKTHTYSADLFEVISE